MKVEYHTVSQVTQLGGAHWQLLGTRTEDDGTQRSIAYQFPADTMEWRAAEYGLDPDADRATLLDIVMAESLLRSEDYDGGYQLYDAPDMTTAREHHVARCARAKLRCRLSTRGKDHLLNRVRDESPMHPEILSIKRSLVAKTRDEHQKRRAALVELSSDGHEHRRLMAWRAQHNEGGDA